MYTHKSLEKHSETWTDAGNTGNRGKERKENFGSQLSISLKWAPGLGTEAAVDSGASYNRYRTGGNGSVTGETT